MATKVLEDEILAPGVLSSMYITGIARAEKGAWPMGVAGAYGIDDAHLAVYARAAKTPEGFRQYLEQYVLRAA